MFRLLNSGYKIWSTNKLNNGALKQRKYDFKENIVTFVSLNLFVYGHKYPWLYHCTLMSNILCRSGEIVDDDMAAANELSTSDPSKREFWNLSLDEASDLGKIVLRIDKYLLSSCRRLCFWLGVLVRTLWSPPTAPEEEALLSSFSL